MIYITVWHLGHIKTTSYFTNYWGLRYNIGISHQIKSLQSTPDKNSKFSKNKKGILKKLIRGMVQFDRQ